MSIEKRATQQDQDLIQAVALILALLVVAAVAARPAIGGACSTTLGGFEPASVPAVAVPKLDGMLRYD